MMAKWSRLHGPRYFALMEVVALLPSVMTDDPLDLLPSPAPHPCRSCAACSHCRPEAGDKPLDPAIAAGGLTEDRIEFQAAKAKAEDRVDDIKCQAVTSPMSRRKFDSRFSAPVRYTSDACGTK
jgi:hypothetical protein